jgi:anti-sigma factor RsiW
MREPKIHDRDLMLFLDGELEGEELERLERALADDERARGKLLAMNVVGDALRDAANGDSRADGIADAVMAQLDAEPAEREHDLEAVKARALPVATPANDNSRTLWSLAAAAAAVAAGLFVWGNMAPSDAPVATAPRTEAVVESPALEASERIEALEGAAPAAPAIGAAKRVEDEDAVEIARLDFGAHTGSVFKVRDENTGASTAVVWVTDSGDDE